MYAATAATSAACGMPIALFGALSFGLFGITDSSVGSAQFGFIYMPALLGIVVASFPGALIGARLAAKLPAPLLAKLFALMLLAIGGYILVRALLQFVA